MAVPAAVATPVHDEGFRVRVAREKRERMRQRLQNAAIEVFRGASMARSPVVEGVIQAAAVSRGTFYKYYQSLEELLSEIGQQVAGDVLQTYKVLIAGSDSAATNLLTGPVLSMVHAGMDPARALITARMDFFEYFTRENDMKNILANALLKAHSETVVHYDDIDAATDYVVGATLEGMRRMAQLQQVDEAYILSVARMIGRGLDMTPHDADLALEASWQAIHANVARLTWWNPEKLSSAQRGNLSDQHINDPVNQLIR
mgnify:FL=1